MAYSQEQIKAVNKQYHKVNVDHHELTLNLMSFHNKLKNNKAREYVSQGVARRLKTIIKCINNIYAIFPPNRTELLSGDELTDVAINLHAFFINIAGIFDNLGWVFVYEKDLFGERKDGKLTSHDIGLFQKKTQAHLNAQFKDYLTSDPIKRWHKVYSSNYRDSLAHRIPLYVPPYIINKDDEKKLDKIEKEKDKLDFSKACDRTRYNELEQMEQELGKVSHVLTHSYTEGAQPIYFHAQTVTDYATIEEVINNFITYFK